MTADSKELRERAAVDIRSTTTREEINRLTSMGFHAHLMWKEDITALLSTNEALARENERLREALIHAIEVAEEAFNEWDAAPDGMRAGKILKALSGSAPRYRADIDAIHDALIPPETRQALEPSHDQ